MKRAHFLTCSGLHFRALDVLKAQFCWCTHISLGVVTVLIWPYAFLFSWLFSSFLS